MKALIDGDWLAYYIGYSVEHTHYTVKSRLGSYRTDAAKDWRAYVKNAGLGQGEYELNRTRTTDELCVALDAADNKMAWIVEELETLEWSLVFSGKDNFRDAIFPYYKAHRHDGDKPIYISDVKRHLEHYWDAFTADYIEADDYLGLAAFYHKNTSVIVTVDKDLDTVPGRHFNPVRKEHYFVEEEDAERIFWQQMLVGDRSDNIQGIVGIGPVRARRIIKDASATEDMPGAVYNYYADEFGQGTDDMFSMNQALLRILRPDCLGILGQEEKKYVKQLLKQHGDG